MGLGAFCYRSYGPLFAQLRAFAFDDFATRFNGSHMTIYNLSRTTL